jgi:hypothetical protein
MSEESLTPEEEDSVEKCFIRYVSELEIIAWTHSLSMKNMLTEEEVIVSECYLFLNSLSLLNCNRLAQLFQSVPNPANERT